MNLADLVEQFRAKLEDKPEGPSDAVAAIETLLDLIRSSKGVYIACIIIPSKCVCVQLRPSLGCKMRSKLLPLH